MNQDAFEERKKIRMRYIYFLITPHQRCEIRAFSLEGSKYWRISSNIATELIRDCQGDFGHRTKRRMSSQ
jgi:hypothetical protein